MVHYLRNKKVTIVTVIALLVLSVLSITYFKLNLGPFFYDSTVLLLQFDNETATDNVAGEIDKVVKSAAIEKESTSKFYVFFQNLSDADRESINNSLPVLFPGLISSSYYSYQPVREHLLLVRTVVITAVVAIIASIALLFLIKGLGLKRGEALNLLVNEILLFTFMTIVLLGYMSLLGGLGLVMDIPFFVFTVCALFLLIIFELYYVFRFKDLAKGTDKYDLGELESKISRYNWPEFLFLLAVAVLIFFVPWIVISVKIALSATQVLVAILLASYSFFILRAHLNKFEIINFPLISRWRFMQKKW